MASWDPLRANWDDLVRKLTNLNSLLDYLYRRQVISTDNRGAIQRESDPQNRVRMLLSLIQNHQDETAFQKFLMGLRATGNGCLADLLSTTWRLHREGTDVASATFRRMSLDAERQEPSTDGTVVLGPDLGSGIKLSALRGCTYHAGMNELYVTSIETGQVFVCNAQGKNPGVFYKVASPCDVAVSVDGDRVCVIAGVFDSVLHILTWKGELRKIVKSIPAGKLGACEAVACYKQNIAVLSSRHGVILFTQTGDYVGKWALPNDMVGRGMAIDAEGRVYITDAKTGAVTVFSSKGEVLETFGEVRKSPWFRVKEMLLQGGAPKNPWSPGICVDNDDNVCVSRFEANRVDVYNRERSVITSFGVKGNKAGQFEGPYGLCLLSGGRLVVTDSSNHRIQIFKMF